MSETTARPLDSYTYADYAGFPDDMRCEIIEGVVVMMAPAPGWTHQSIVLRISQAFGGQLKGHECRPAVSPVDVFLDYTNDIRKCRNIVQPDVLVVCDSAKIDERGILGAPDLVVEVVSPSSLDHDVRRKVGLYGKYGVPEYWMVWPKMMAIVVYTLENGEYTAAHYCLQTYDEEKVVVTSSAVPGLTLELAEVFEGQQ